MSWFRPLAPVPTLAPVPPLVRTFEKSNEAILAAILADAVDALAAAVFASGDASSQRFGFDALYLPRLLSSCPPLVSVCAYFAALGCLQLLIDAGADVGAEDLLGRTPVFFAMAGGSLAAVRLLGADADALRRADLEGNLPVHVACEHGFVDGVNYAYTKGRLLQLSAPNALRQVPLLLAAGNGHLPVLRLLRDVGVNLLDSDGEGWNALHYACAAGYADAAEWLIDAGIGVDRTTHDSETPLVIAAARGSLRCVRLLVERGSQHARVTNRRHVPIVAAAAAGHVDVVRYLEAIGASRHSRTSAGETPQSAARNCDQPGVLAYFKRNPRD
jgi:ankyrin repeat protein